MVYNIIFILNFIAMKVKTTSLAPNYGIYVKSM